MLIPHSNMLHPWDCCCYLIPTWITLSHCLGANMWSDCLFISAGSHHYLKDGHTSICQLYQQSRKRLNGSWDCHAQHAIVPDHTTSDVSDQAKLQGHTPYRKTCPADVLMRSHSMHLQHPTWETYTNEEVYKPGTPLTWQELAKVATSRAEQGVLFDLFHQAADHCLPGPVR